MGILLLFPVVVDAATVLGVGRSSGTSGEATETPVTLLGDTPIVGIQLDLGYSPDTVVPGSLALAERFRSSAYRLESSEVEAGRHRVVIFSDDNRDLRGGEVLTIPLSFTETVAEGERGIEILAVELADASGLSRRFALAPYVDILAPGAGNEFQAGQPVVVEADAYAATGDLAEVSFYVDGELEATRTSGPYSFTWTPDARGGYEVAVVAANTESVESEARRMLNVLSRFDNWAREQFPAEQLSNPAYAGFSGDADGDGILNGIEYLTNLNPLAMDTRHPLQTSIVEVGGERYLSVSFEFPTSADDVDFEVYAASRVDAQAAGGAQAAILMGQQPLDDGVVRRTYRDPEPIGDGSRFMYIETSLQGSAN
ncbi:MAG: hypothetical protein GVY10_09330 [Verrucomicrobia bacterium]|jgi:hypothetical protein|nr:hypothetical protein [Verrucomicrobiota bacterium]